MLYKVTPMLPAAEEQPKRAREPGQPRKKRKSAVYDHEGNEVLITLMCLKCRTIKPLAQFGLRKMADGAIRNQPWCRQCRSGAGVPKPRPQPSEVQPVAVAQVAEAIAELPAAEPALPAVAEPAPEPVEAAEALPPAEPAAAPQG